MYTDTPSLTDLFEQLGLDSDDSAISMFIETNKALPGNIHIADAPFWSKAQSSFVRTALLEDAEWAELIDQLSQRLRAN